MTPHMIVFVPSTGFLFIYRLHPCVYHLQNGFRPLYGVSIYLPLPSAYLVNQGLYVWFAGQITNQTFFFETNNFLWLFSLFYGYRRKLILLRTLSFPFPYHKVPPDILYIYRHEEQVLILYLSYVYGFHTVFPVYF